MITNVERVLKKSWKEAENKGVEKGVPVEEITEYTGLSEEEIEKLK